MKRIKKVNRQDNFYLFAKLLNKAFATVAEEYGLTKENAPTNNAFITSELLLSQFIPERDFYWYEEGEEAIGFIAIERSVHEPFTFYIEKLAVHPDSRHKGIGKELMRFAENRIQELEGKFISLGLIDSNTWLKEWYKNQGYKVSETKTYEHLPFRVCIMKKEIF